MLALCPTKALAGLTNIAGCLGPDMIRSAFALLLRAMQQILEGFSTGGSQVTSSTEYGVSSPAPAAALRSAAHAFGPPSMSFEQSPGPLGFLQACALPGVRQIDDALTVE
jgi:hypothetical protein